MFRSALIALLLATTAGCATQAQPHQASDALKAHMATSTTSQDFLKRFDRLTSRVYDLCNKMTEAQLNWRPAPGVRSMLEALGHLNATQYRLASFAGTPVPADVKLEAIEALATKSSVMAAFKTSNTRARATLVGLTNGDMERAANVWGRPATVRFAALLMVAHQAEHLGQAISYGRKQGVVPPWSK